MDIMAIYNKALRKLLVDKMAAKKMIVNQMAVSQMMTKC
jgi:hypothetical protein